MDSIFLQVIYKLDTKQLTLPNKTTHALVYLLHQILALNNGHNSGLSFAEFRKEFDLQYHHKKIESLKVHQNSLD